MEWKIIHQFDDKYKISSSGVIKPVENKINNLKVTNFHGYKTINYKSKTHYVHRLVAKAFIPNPNNKPCVNHKDGNKLNNHIDNLEWCTYSENNKHAYRTGLKKPNTITNKNRPIVMLDDNKKEICVFMKMNNTKGMFNKNMSPNIIRAIKKGTKAGGYHWKYLD